MNFKPLEKRLHNLCEKAIANHVFPGVAAGISIGQQSDRKEFITTHGFLSYPNSSGQPHLPDTPKPIDQETFFDLASLTKPFSILLSILCLKKSKKVKFTDNLAALLDLKIPSPLNTITIAHLLSHSSGLPAYRPYFIKLIDYPKEERHNLLRTWILQEKLSHPPGTETVYSDLGYMLLGWVVEQQSGQALNDFVEQTVLVPLNMARQIQYNPENKPGPSTYAPTENCPWRRTVLTGQVHDDNCFALNGIAGHAGLFGNINGVMNLATHLLDSWHDRTTHPNYHSNDLKQAAKKQHSNSTWAMGFDTPSQTNNSSSGRFLSRHSFGHLGFTGTSFWIDPTIDLVIVLLTNRVHPSRDNDLIRKFRPLFHDTILQWLTDES